MNPLSSSEPETMDWLPRTKLASTALDDNFLVRHRVLNALHNAISNFRLTLLSAPTGYGKSNLLHLWCQATSGCGHSDGAMQAAYLSLDATENDCTHFLLALIAALQTLHPACGQRAQRFLAQDGNPKAVDEAAQTQILTDLIVVDIEQFLPCRVVLVLDNYEQISEPTVHSALSYLLRRLPQQAHVVVSTTQDPPFSLTEMHAFGSATLLSAETLAFDEVESAAFLDKVAELSLPTEQKLALHRYTEGWPVGLSLLAQELHALPHDDERIHFIDALNDGVEPPVVWPAVEAYLRAGLFDELPRPLRTFLMQTSILSILNADVCQAVTTCHDADELLRAIYQRNLFLFRHDTRQEGDGPVNAVDSQPLFRYHRLFAAFLRRRLHQEMPDQITQLHRRAAEAEAQSEEKLRHYLAAKCWTEVAQMLAIMHKEGDWPSNILAQLARSSEEMPHHVRKALTVGRAVPPPAAVHLGLTARQFEVLTLLDRGASNHTIASELFVTLATVKGHISKVMRILGVRTRHDAVRRAAELGLLPH